MSPRYNLVRNPCNQFPRVKSARDFSPRVCRLLRYKSDISGGATVLLLALKIEYKDGGDSELLFASRNSFEGNDDFSKQNRRNVQRQCDI